MDFNVQLTKNGKPHIIFDNHKFRESYVSKGGDITWRCLGKSCNASIKTDADRTNIISSCNKHSGPHPVTIRSLSSPRTQSPASRGQSSSALGAAAADPITTELPRNCKTRNKFR